MAKNAVTVPYPSAAAPTEPPRSAGRRARRVLVILLALFVAVGIASLVWLMTVYLPEAYRQQAARMIAPSVRAAQIGDSVFLGAYEQDNDLKNGAEPIEWIVLDRQDDRSLLICRYALDCVSFNNVEAFVTWDRSTILTWLNGTFYNDAFNGAERTMLLTSAQLTDKNPYFDTDPGDITNERLFLLNIEQATDYLPTEENRMCQATPYALEKGAIADKDSGNCIWWLRSPGFDASVATRVLTDGRINYSGNRVQDGRHGVRPCVWVTFDPNAAEP